MAGFRHSTKPQRTKHPDGDGSDNATLEPVGARDRDYTICKSTVETRRERARHHRGSCVRWHGRESLADEGRRNQQRRAREEKSIHGRRLTDRA